MARFYHREIGILQPETKLDILESEFTLLLRVLTLCLRDHALTESAFLTLRNGGLCLVLENKQSRFDPEFEDALTELAVCLGSDSDLNPLNIEILALSNSFETTISILYNTSDDSSELTSYGCRAIEEPIATSLNSQFYLKYVRSNSNENQES